MIPFTFSVVLRGYEPQAVDALVTSAVAALATADERARADAAAALRGAALPVVLRGFDRQQVDDAIASLTAQLEGADPAPPDGEPAQTAEFDVTLRGYEPAAVDRLVAQVEQALTSGNATTRAGAAAAVRQAAFPVKFRGYSRVQVDRYLEQKARELA
jgi:DivIVA domain-containing protein